MGIRKRAWVSSAFSTKSVRGRIPLLPAPLQDCILSVFCDCQQENWVKPSTVVLELALLIRTNYKKGSHVECQRWIHRGNITHETHVPDMLFKTNLKKVRSKNLEYFSHRFCKLSSKLALNKLCDFKLLTVQLQTAEE